MPSFEITSLFFRTRVAISRLPNGIASDEDGTRTLVSDQNCIEFKFLIAKSGDFLLGVLGTGDDLPAGLCVDLLNGQIAVVDQMNKRVVCLIDEKTNL
jgi:hypothetical protein